MVEGAGPYLRLNVLATGLRRYRLDPMESPDLTIERARALRRRMTLPEVVLW
jgi:hypothetical protein